LRLRRRIDPAGMDASAQAIGRLGINRPIANQTAKRRLDVTARATKSVIQVKVTKRGIEVVPRHQNHDPAAKPNAFGVSSRAVNGLCRFHEFVGFALIVLGCIGGGGGRSRRRFARLILAMKIATLGDSASDTDQKCKPGEGEAAQHRSFKQKHPSTHKFPDCFSHAANADALVWCRSNRSPMRQSRWRIPMTDISDFVQQSHNFVVS
jgi:hypothetical protein